MQKEQSDSSMGGREFFYLFSLTTTLAVAAVENTHVIIWCLTAAKERWAIFTLTIVA